MSNDNILFVLIAGIIVIAVIAFQIPADFWPTFKAIFATIVIIIGTLFLGIHYGQEMFRPWFFALVLALLFFAWSPVLESVAAAGHLYYDGKYIPSLDAWYVSKTFNVGVYSMLILIIGISGWRHWREWH